MRNCHGVQSLADIVLINGHLVVCPFANPWQCLDSCGYICPLGSYLPLAANMQRVISTLADSPNFANQGELLLHAIRVWTGAALVRTRPGCLQRWPTGLQDNPRIRTYYF
jgi:hypothetical protein